METDTPARAAITLVVELFVPLIYLHAARSLLMICRLFAQLLLFVLSLISVLVEWPSTYYLLASLQYTEERATSLEFYGFYFKIKE